MERKTQRTGTMDIRERRRRNRRIRKFKVLLRRTAAIIILIGMIITANQSDALPGIMRDC